MLLYYFQDGFNNSGVHSWNKYFSSFCLNTDKFKVFFLNGLIMMVILTVFLGNFPIFGGSHLADKFKHPVGIVQLVHFWCIFLELKK